MSKVLKQFEEFLFRGSNYSKLFKKQTPGKRILPQQAKDNDAKYQLRLDAGESINGKKTVYLQVNSQVKSGKLAEYARKNGTYANLASAKVDENTPAEQQEDAAKKFWEDLDEQAKKQLS